MRRLLSQGNGSRILAARTTGRCFRTPWYVTWSSSRTPGRPSPAATCGRAGEGFPTVRRCPTGAIADRRFRSGRCSAQGGRARNLYRANFRLAAGTFRCWVISDRPGCHRTPAMLRGSPTPRSDFIVPLRDLRVDDVLVRIAEYLPPYGHLTCATLGDPAPSHFAGELLVAGKEPQQFPRGMKV